MPKETLQDLLRGRGAHVDPVAIVDGMSVELAGRELPGAQHTIWQLVWHMNYWMDYELRSLQGSEPVYLEHAAESWPSAAGPRDRAEWEAGTARFRQQVEELAVWGQRATREGQFDRLVHPGHNDRVGDVLWQMSAHNSYHSGQVALLRRDFGAWPPVSGGDTW